MDPLYVVELNVAVAESSALGPEGIYDRLVEHATRWLSHDVEGGGPDLSQSGRAELPARHGSFEFTRTARWTVTHSERLRAVHCVMRQPMEGGHGAQFVCEFTLFQENELGAIRVELGRESVDGLLSPVSVQFLRRPGLLSSALRDDDLRLTYQGQLIDGRYEWINPPQAAVVPEVIAIEKRLPILLVDGGDEHAKDLGSAAANQLSGLAQVLLIDRRSRARIAAYLDSIGAPLPDHGARLVWPILNTRHPEFWDLGRTETIVNTLMKIVAPVSVTARGTNRLRVMAAEESQREREASFQTALAEAVARGGQSAELDVLRDRVAELVGEVAQWVEEVERLTRENESLPGLQRQLGYWKTEAQRAYQATSPGDHAAWEACPDLEADDMSKLAKFLEEASDGAIVFTAAALRSWSKSGYPHVEAMRDALVKLAQAATEWRRAECNTGMRMKEWLKTRFELNYSQDDRPLEQMKAHKFAHDGKSYTREQHLKLDDHVKPNEVGRVYFATDSEERRFIVDHVGLKLYGI